MNEIQLVLMKELLLTAIILIGCGVVLYQVLIITKKHTIHKMALVIYGMFFTFMIGQLFVQIVAYF